MLIVWGCWLNAWLALEMIHHVSKLHAACLLSWFRLNNGSDTERCQQMFNCVLVPPKQEGRNLTAWRRGEMEMLTSREQLQKLLGWLPALWMLLGLALKLWMFLGHVVEHGSCWDRYTAMNDCQYGFAYVDRCSWVGVYCRILVPFQFLVQLNNVWKGFRYHLYKIRNLPLLYLFAK